MSLISKNNSNKLGIIIWLILLTSMVLLMIIVGGLTRLTESGLSMVDWRPIMGTLPPLNNESWIEVFDNYKKSPEFLIINNYMTLNEFKYIFWWEWAHRFLARCLGVVFLIPFVYFLFKKSLSNKLIISVMIVLCFGILQAVVGWWMVKSGLVDNPYVSSYRLAFHLFIAMIIFTMLFWISISVIYNKEKNYNASKLLKHLFHFSLFLIFLTIISGAFMSGSDAGKSFNTYPLMDERLFPEEYYINSYGWLNIFENIVAINFNHRWLATFTFLFVTSVIIYALFSKKFESNKISLYLALFFIFFQFLLGILTLIYGVPIFFASLHQTNSVLLLGSMLFSYYKINYK